MSLEQSSTPRGWLDVERWLGTTLGRWILVLCLVAVATTVTSVQRYDILSIRGWDIDIGRLVLRELIGWSIWAIVVALSLRASGWLLKRTGRPLAVVALQIPLAIGAGVGMSYADFWIGNLLGSNSSRGDRGSSRGFNRGFNNPRRMLSFRLPRTLFMYFALLGLGAGAEAFLRQRREERRATLFELKAARLDGELADAQLASLRAQLHPHFLFNALHTVGGLVREGKETSALETLSAIGELLRTTLDQGEQHESRLADELRVAKRYLEIEAVRFGDRLFVEWEIEEGCSDAQLPALFLLPLVENAVRHGIAPRTEGGRVRVRAARDGDRLELEVSDDGPGFPDGVLVDIPSTVDEHGRRPIGLSNDRQRLRMLYGDEQSFELSNPAEGGAKVTVRIPFHTRSDSGARG